MHKSNLEIISLIFALPVNWIENVDLVTTVDSGV